MSPTLDRRTFLQSIAATGVTLSFAGIASAQGQTRYLVRGRGSRVANQVEAAGFTIDHELADGSVLIVTGPDDSLGELQGLRGVSRAAPDFRFELEGPATVETTDEIELDQVFLGNQWDRENTETLDAHDVATGDGSRIAIIDTGVDDAHPDLGNVNAGLSVSVIGGSIGGHTGDVQGHGTHVAGIAAATGAFGVVGIAPDAEVVSVRVFDGSGGASFGDILIAMEYAAAIDADSANLSIGTPPIPPQANSEQYRGIMEPVAQSVTGQGTLLVGSAGNSGADLQHGGFFTLPNSLQGLLSISSTAPNDELSYYSNFGTNEIDLGAPGGGYETLAKSLCAYQEWLVAGAPSLISNDPREPGDIGTLWLDGDGVPTTDPAAVAQAVPCEIPEWPVPFNFVFSTYAGGSYAWLAGTSMAAPQVTGAAALVREVSPNSNAHQVEKTIKQGAELTSGQSDPELGAGRLNVSAMLE